MDKNHMLQLITKIRQSVDSGTYDIPAVLKATEKLEKIVKGDAPAAASPPAPSIPRPATPPARPTVPGSTPHP